MKLKRPHRHDKIRMIFFSTGDSEIRQFDINLQRLLLFVFMGSFVLVGLFMASVTICDNLFQDKTDVFSHSKDVQKQVSKLHVNLERLTTKLEDLENETEDLEVLVGLTKTNDDSSITQEEMQVTKEILMASLPVDYEYETDSIEEYLNSLETRIDQALNIQGSIEDEFMQTDQDIKRIPSIRPVQGGRITDKFGHRKDPFVERVKHHKGIDLSARYGTEVYAAASGVVEFTRVRYRLNKGYGRVIIVNHKNGFKTLYGHLSKIYVKPGQLVERWDVLGLSGNTGRATGPHLHYEVWHKGRAQDPENFLLN
ncbi:MAG: M23 family metallopeptidase [bacterium]